MRTDFDLQFLQSCNNEDLRILCDILMYDNHGKIRISEELSNSDAYLRSYPNNMVGMWKDLALELKRYGGNSILNVLRNGQGPSYEKVVLDVCKRMGVTGITKYDTAEEMEQKLLIAVSKKVIGEMSEAEIRSIMEECDISGYDYTRAGLVAAILALHVVNRRLFNIIIINILRLASQVLVGRGLMMMGMGVVSRGIGALCGPIGWALMFGWTAWDLMGPAYRVTIPAVIQVAYMRAKYQAKSNSNSECA